MKKYKSIGKLLAVSFFTAVIASACTEDAMDKVNKNPNNPQDAPAKFLITDLGVSTAFSTVGGDFSLYSSVTWSTKQVSATNSTGQKSAAENRPLPRPTTMRGSAFTPI